MTRSDSGSVAPGVVVRISGGRYAGSVGRVRRVESNGLAYVVASGYLWGWLVPAEFLHPLGILKDGYARAVERIRGGAGGCADGV